MYALEVKNGPSARYNSRQRDLDAQLGANGGLPRGPRAVRAFGPDGVGVSTGSMDVHVVSPYWNSAS